MMREAIFDTSGTYRYRLSRRWDAALPRVCFVMLNPSTADAEREDPTIRRCISLARAWGYGSLDVVNLFAFRATRPAVLKAAPDPVGPDNDRYLQEAAASAALVVVAWGNHGAHQGRDRAVASFLPKACCLGITATGQPRHPLYVRSDVVLQIFPTAIQ